MPAGRPYLDGDIRPEISWPELMRRVGDARTFWLATTRSGRPHVMPLLGVAVDGAIFFCVGPNTQKGRNLARDSRCVLTTAADGVDIVVEGVARRGGTDESLNAMRWSFARR